LGDVSCHHLDRHIRHEAIVSRDEAETPVNECLRLLLYLGLVASLPAATGSPEDNRVILALFGCVDIEGLTLVLRLRVGEVTMHLRLLSESRSSKNQKSKKVSHCDQSPKKPQSTRSARWAWSIRPDACDGLGWSHDR